MLESWTRVQVHGNVWCEHNATRRPAIALAKATRHENLRFHADAGTQIKASGAANRGMFRRVVIQTKQKRSEHLSLNPSTVLSQQRWVDRHQQNRAKNYVDGLHTTPPL